VKLFDVAAFRAFECTSVPGPEPNSARARYDVVDCCSTTQAPTHATKAGIRYRYYVSLPCLHGAAKTAKVGSVTRVPATDIEEVVVKSLKVHLSSERGMPASAITDHNAIAEVIDRIDVYRDRLAVRLRSRESHQSWSAPCSMRSSKSLQGRPRQQGRPLVH
jgi:site-specific DNA recombinase